MAEYHIDYNRGNDANDGTSSGTGAWQNLSKLAEDRTVRLVGA